MSEQVPAQVATEEEVTEDQASEVVEQQGTELDNLAAMKAELNQARRDAAKYRTAAKKATEAEEERKREKMSEVEKLKADMAAIEVTAQAAETRAQQAMIKAAVMYAASGFNDPDDALRLLDIDTLEVDDDGNIEGIDDAITALLKAKPYLAKTKQGGISPTNPAAEPQAETYEQLKAQANQGAVSAMFAGGGVLKQE